MAGKVLSLIVSLVLFFSFSACSTTASDTVSYSSYVQKVEKLQSQSKEFEKQFRKLKKTSKGVDAVRKEAKITRDNMANVYHIARSLVDRAKRLEVSFLASPGALSNQASKWSNLRTDVKNFVGPENVIDNLFHDPENKNVGDIKTLEERFDSRKKTLNDLISDCEGIIFSAFGRIKQVDILVSKMNKAESSSEFVSLTDQYVSQIQDLFFQLINLSFRFQGITEIVQFAGVSDEVQQKKTKVKEVKKFELPHTKSLRERGIDPDNLTDQTLFDIINGRYRK